MDKEVKLSSLFYSNKVAGMINDLIANAIALGFMLVVFSYIRLLVYQSDFALLQEADFWKRIIILLFIIAFLAYDRIGYKIHMEMQENISSKKFAADDISNSKFSRKVIYLFLIDLSRIIASAGIISAVSIGDIVNMQRHEVLSRLQINDVILLYTMFSLACGM